MAWQCFCLFLCLWISVKQSIALPHADSEELEAMQRAFLTVRNRIPSPPPSNVLRPVYPDYVQPVGFVRLSALRFSPHGRITIIGDVYPTPYHRNTGDVWYRMNGARSTYVEHGVVPRRYGPPNSRSAYSDRNGILQYGPPTNARSSETSAGLVTREHVNPTDRSASETRRQTPRDTGDGRSPRSLGNEERDAQTYGMEREGGITNVRSNSGQEVSKQRNKEHRGEFVPYRLNKHGFYSNREVHPESGPRRTKPGSRKAEESRPFPQRSITPTTRRENEGNFAGLRNVRRGSIPNGRTEDGDQHFAQPRY